MAGGVYNLGTGAGESIGAIARKILDLINVEAEIVTDPTRLRPPGSEVDRLISDNSAFRRRTGWAPKYDLADGLAETIAFFRSHPGLLPRQGYVL
jgi:nucleoside-diphosphate-sugar epimerase